ncbi:hypothetical protein SOPP22_18795 [Shewanella sp. OPT22]|nr:hypothetical protein SOPP22_18795 [Shewanella sp. OPT22]
MSLTANYIESYIREHPNCLMDRGTEDGALVLFIEGGYQFYILCSNKENDRVISNWFKFKPTFVEQVQAPAQSLYEWFVTLPKPIKANNCKQVQQAAIQLYSFGHPYENPIFDLVIPVQPQRTIKSPSVIQNSIDNEQSTREDEGLFSSAIFSNPCTPPFQVTSDHLQPKVQAKPAHPVPPNINNLPSDIQQRTSFNNEFIVVRREVSEGLEKFEEWYFDKQNVLPPMRRQGHWDEFSDLEADFYSTSGVNLLVSNRDDFFIELQQNLSAPEWSPEKIERFHYIHRKLSDYESFVPAIVVKPRTICTPNEGTILRTSCELKRSKVEIQQFTTLLRDLDALGDQNIFPLDVHLKNLVLKDKNAQVKMIDLDRVYMEGVSLSEAHFGAQFAVGHLDIITELSTQIEIAKISLKEKPCDIESQHFYRLYPGLINAVQQSLNYSTIVSIIVSNSPVQFIKHLNKCNWTRGEHFYFQCSDEINHWIENNVNPKYIDNLKQFLQAPIEHPLQAKLSELFLLKD